LLVPTMVIMFLIQAGNFLNIGCDHVYNMINPLTWGKGDILNTYVFRTGLEQGKYSFATAIGLFQSLVGFILIVGGDRIAKKVAGRGFF
jgi:putative aldouronate transport system permease protein